MYDFGQSANPLTHKATNKNTVVERPVLTPKQLQKQDALDLAELIYDMYKDGLSSANMEENNEKDNNNG
ncbi:MAG TPA: hypothetical protein VF575_03295 [Candidatus Saccharimonadales bacterium]|jgi:hypothetical protein